jgi:hypothetical protein
MTIQSTDRKAGPFLSGTVLPFEFKVFSKEDIQVIWTSAAGVESILVLDSEYSVTLNPDQDNTPGGSVTLNTAISGGANTVIIGDLIYDQGTDIRNQSGFEPETIEDALDRVTILVQQLLEMAKRTLRIPASSSSSISTQLPQPTSGNVLGWNGEANQLVNLSPQDIATTVAFGTAFVDQFEGDGVETEFALSANPALLANMDVQVDGVSLRNGIDFVLLAGAVIKFTTPPAAPGVPGEPNIQVRGTVAVPQGFDTADVVVTQLPDSGLWTTVQGFINRIISEIGASIVGYKSAGTNAIATTVKAALDYNVNILNWGILSDGSDQTVNWLKMRDDLIAIDPNRHWHIWMNGGTVIVKDNTLFDGFKRYTVHARGATLINDISSTSPTGKQSLRMGKDMFGLPSARVFGYYINTVNEVQTSVNCTTAADAANFSAGHQVLIYGANMFEGGFPPNPKYFEFNEVVSANATTGAIVLRYPTKYQYRADWPENVGSGNPTGKARIHNLTAMGFCEYAEWNDLKAPRVNPPFSTNVVLTAAIDTVFNNCDLGTYYPTTGRKIIQNGGSGRWVVLDKIVDYIEFNFVDIIEKFSEGTGVNRLVVNGGSRAPNCEANLYGPRCVSIDSCEMYGVVPVSGRNYLLRLNSLYHNNVKYALTNCDIHLDEAITYENIAYLQINTPAVTLTSVTGNDVVLNIGSISDAMGRYQRGAWFVTQTGKTGQINYVREGSGGYGTWIHNVTTSEPLVITDVLFFNRVDALNLAGTKINGKSYYRQFSKVTGDIEDVMVLDLMCPIFGRSSVFNDVSLGLVSRIEVDVIRPYTGPDVGARLRLDAYTGAINTYLFGLIDLTATGRRIKDVGEAAVAIGTDPSWTGLLPATRSNVVNRVRVETRLAAGGAIVLNGTEDQMPIVNLRVYSRSALS